MDARSANRPLTISVVGAGSADAKLMEAAHAVGKEIALRGGVVVCGGLGGVMEGACRGAAQAGGEAVAIPPPNRTASGSRACSASMNAATPPAFRVPGMIDRRCASLSSGT